FRFANTVGVSDIVFFDPMNRPVAKAHADYSWSKVTIDPWRQEESDGNDTVLLDPKSDPDAGAYFQRLPDAAYLPTWYDRRQAGGLGPDERDSALKTAVHAGTPQLSFFDAMGRAALKIAQNRFQYSGQAPAVSSHRAETVFDIEANERRIVDAAGRICA